MENKGWSNLTLGVIITLTTLPVVSLLVSISLLWNDLTDRRWDDYDTRYYEESEARSEGDEDEWSAWPKEPLTVEVEGEFTLPVPGRWTVGPGPANIPYRFYYSGSESSILARVAPLDPETEIFRDQWESHIVDYIEERAMERFGDVFYDQLYYYEPLVADDGGGEVYAATFTLFDGTQRMEVTFAFCFTQSFTLEVIGVDMGDMPELEWATLDSAMGFVDHTEPGYPGPSFYSTGEFTVDPGNWDLPVNNVLAVVEELSRWYYNEEVSEERALTDYEIQWNSPVVEMIAREVTRKPDGPVLSSDLDKIRELSIKEDGWNNPGHYSYSIPDVGGKSFDMEPITDIGDLVHFQQLEKLTLQLTTVSDLSALEQLDKVTYVQLYMDPETEDFSPIGGMTSLETLFMWGQDRPNLTDLGFLRGLDNLHTIYLVASNLKDVAVLTELPSLENVYINGHEDLDQQPLVDCERITELLLNAEKIRP